MTTIESEGIRAIIGRLDQIQLRRRGVRLVTGIAAVAAIVLLSLALALPIAGVWPAQPPAVLRYALLAALVGLWAAAIISFIIRSLLWRQNSAQTARFVEQAMPELRNDLINSVLLAADKQQVAPELVDLAVREATLRSSKVDIFKSISIRSLRRWLACTAAGALLLGALVFFAPSLASRGFAAIFMPHSYLAQTGSVRILTVTPGDAAAFIGESIRISASIDNPGRQTLTGEVIIEGQDQPRAMIPNDNLGVFSFVMDDLKGDVKYAVRIGDTRWPADKPFYRISVLQRVKVESMEIAYNYPPYTNLPAKSGPSADGTIEAPAGTTATVTVHLSEPVPAAMLEVRDGAIIEMSCRELRTFHQNVAVEKDGAYKIELRDRRGKLIQQLPDIASASGAGELASGYFRIHAIPDRAPKVEFLTPVSNVSVAPGGSLPVRLKVSDDYCIDHVQFLLGKEGTERPVPDFNAKPALKAKAATLEYTVSVAADTPEGTELVFYATATDNYPKAPQTTTSYKFKILVQDSARLAAQKAQLHDQLRARLLALLKMQEHQRVNSAIAASAKDIQKATEHGKLILQGQGEIQAQLSDVLAKTQFDQDTVMFQQALAVLAQNEAPLAVEQARVLSTVGAMTERDNQCKLLAGTQNRIINTLQTLLAILPGVAQENSQATSKPEGDLSPEAKQKLAQLHNDLQQFIDAQKKIVQASESLAKKDVDQFTAEDDKLLQDLKAQQDQWEKFLSEKFADFSKMAAQDFSNPVMMKELIAVKSDVTMAKDALSQKAVEIATAVEDNGIENAKTLTANIEKWLPDTPDRQKWAMEDPVDGQMLTEQPELPKELEDLVGDLLEEEADLFDEMQDQTSKYNMSGDKGIGWDAMDGPISSMNAQGVTGNQLPNSNEMSGRAGEGRQGKASGEFVEDKAVGKGGRRTPTRLTAEPFQKGQINDQSAEAAGGATGGGKVSGAGADGLEGPIPPPLAKEMERLAGKQASLINRAERIKAQFKQGDYANFKFLQTITLMNKVQDDLKNHRYQNVLRAKDSTLEGLKETRLLLTGEVDVKADTSAAMPKRVRDDISDAMKGKMPEQYKGALENYYKRLNQQARE